MEKNLPSHPAAWNVVRIVGWVVLAILVASVLFAGWVSIANWSEIRV